MHALTEATTAEVSTAAWVTTSKSPISKLLSSRTDKREPFEREREKESE